MAKPGAAALLLGLALGLPGLSWAVPEGRPIAGGEAYHALSGSRFKCEDGGNLTARFATRDTLFVAIVDNGDGPHALPIVPWNGDGPVKLTWSDGQRTLTWSPGVRIMWMDGATHRMCGGSEHKH